MAQFMIVLLLGMGLCCDKSPFLMLRTTRFPYNPKDPEDLYHHAPYTMTRHTGDDKKKQTEESTSPFRLTRLCQRRRCATPSTASRTSNGHSYLSMDAAQLKCYRETVERQLVNISGLADDDTPTPYAFPKKLKTRWRHELHNKIFTYFDEMGMNDNMKRKIRDKYFWRYADVDTVY